MNDLIFGVYPYVCLTVFFLGSWLRFDREQYSWKSDSSQLLSKSGMRFASNAFHIGVIMVFFGHFVGLLTPHALFQMIMSDMAHQWMAIIAGAIFGSLAFIGGLMLWMRRMTNTRVSINSRGTDKFIITWIMLTLTLGLITIPVSIGHANSGDAATVIALAEYLQSIAYLHPNPDYLNGVSMAYKIHMLCGMTLFLVFPFTRMVHVWSAPIGYLSRSYQVVRSKRYNDA